ncbi:MAG TPA: four helix bundle protein [Lacunisphaera sp.]|nr:four helix bundle protein [Lacunisphaera sp.]
MSKGGFKSLLVWQKAQALAVSIYQLSKHAAFAREFALADQMRRAALSIPSNIAEGDERDTDKDAVRFFYIAKGSAAELRTQLDLANKVALLSDSDFASLDQQTEEIARMLRGLIKARSPNV